MVDYYPLHYGNHNPPESNFDDYVENGKGRTIAVTVSIRLPTACRCPHCEAAAQFPGRSGNHHKTE